MTSKEQALAQLQHWNQHGYVPTSAWGTVSPPRQTRQSQPKQTGRGGFLSSLISELGGAGGAGGGAALGATIGSVVPGIGTLIGGGLGAAIGGFAGGTVGRGIENKFRDNQNFFGKGGSAKAAFGEGALSGALGAVGTGASAFRGLKAAGGLKELKALTGGGENLANASKSIVMGGKKAGLKIAGGYLPEGNLASGSNRLEARALGFGQGEKLDGRQVTPAMQQQLFGTMKSEGIKSGHPDLVGRQVEHRLNKVGASIESTLNSADRPLTVSERNFLVKNFTAKITDNSALAGSPQAQRMAGSLAKRLNSVHSLKDIVTQRRYLQNAIKDARTSGTPIPGSEQVLREARTALNKLSGTISPELKTLNSRFSNLSRLQEATLNASNSMTKQSRSAGGGLFGTLKAGDTAMGIKASLGSRGRGLADILGNGMVQGAAPVAKGVAVRGVANNMFMPPAQPEMQLPEDPSQFDQGLGAQDQLGMQAPQSPYPLANVIADIQRDPKHASEYLSLYKDVNEAVGAGVSGAPGNVGVVSAQNYGNAQSGYQALGQLQQMLQQDPGVLKKTAVPGSGLPIIGNAIQNARGTAAYDNLAFNIADKYLRLTTGAQANESEVRNVAQKLLPGPFDSPDVVQGKLQQLYNFFGTTLQQANGQSSGGSDLASLLSQGGYQ